MTEKNKYSKQELQEFREIIVEKLSKAQEELKNLREAIRKGDEAMLRAKIKMPDDSAEIAERESLNQLAARQYKFIQHLEAAMERIEKGNYGICVTTGQLISKDRLRVVHHTRHSVTAKQGRV